jgi:hypothetical protein
MDITDTSPDDDGGGGGGGIIRVVFAPRGDVSMLVRRCFPASWGSDVENCFRTRKPELAQLLKD